MGNEGVQEPQNWIADQSGNLLKVGADPFVMSPKTWRSYKNTIEVWFDNKDYKIFLLPLASAACCWFVDNLNNVLQSIEIKLDIDLEK